MTSPTLITQPSRIDSSRGRENRICAYCDEFHTQDDAAKRAQGIGACHAFKDSHPSITAFVPWGGEFCVLFRRAADPQGHRVAFVQRQIQRQGEVA